MPSSRWFHCVQTLCQVWPWWGSEYREAPAFSTRCPLLPCLWDHRLGMRLHASGVSMAFPTWFHVSVRYKTQDPAALRPWNPLLDQRDSRKALGTVPAHVCCWLCATSPPPRHAGWTFSLATWPGRGPREGGQVVVFV